MKRIVIAIFLLMLTTGCTKVEKAESAKTEPVNVSMFQEVENTGMWLVVVDRETGVMYAVSHGSCNSGTFTLLVDAEGKPLIYKGGEGENR
jgi:PBP1b-binding outer membrane lipoprotein LpoB